MLLNIKQNRFRETSYFRPFLTKLFHSIAAMSSVDVCVKKIKLSNAWSKNKVCAMCRCVRNINRPGAPAAFPGCSSPSEMAKLPDLYSDCKQR